MPSTRTTSHTCLHHYATTVLFPSIDTFRPFPSRSRPKHRHLPPLASKPGDGSISSSLSIAISTQTSTSRSIDIGVGWGRPCGVGNGPRLVLSRTGRSCLSTQPWIEGEGEEDVLDGTWKNIPPRREDSTHPSMQRGRRSTRTCPTSRSPTPRGVRTVSWGCDAVRPIQGRWTRCRDRTMESRTPGWNRRRSKGMGQNHTIQIQGTREEEPTA